MTNPIFNKYKDAIDAIDPSLPIEVYEKLCDLARIRMSAEYYREAVMHDDMELESHWINNILNISEELTK